MGRMEHQLEMLRGQIEELAGRLELAVAQMRGRRDLSRWVSAQLHGRMLEARGRGRRMLASTRSRAEDVTEALPEQAERMGPYAIAGMVLLGVLTLAIVAPNVLTNVWNRLTRMFERTRAGMAARTETM